MGSKNVSLRDDVYRELAAEKTDDESFSDVIERLIEMRRGDHPLYDIVGILEDDAVERVRERSDAFRAELDRDLERET